MIETKNLTLIPHLPEHLLALRQGIDNYEKISGRRVADGVRDFLLAGSPDFFSQLEAATAPDPWRFGFAVVHKIDIGAGGSRATKTGKPERVSEPGGELINRLIGMCSFTGSPDSNGVVEIAYGIAPNYQGKGYATEAAAAAVQFAIDSGEVAVIRAHTLPEANASTRVLEKCGFHRAGESIDEGMTVWRWERSTSTS